MKKILVAALLAPTIAFAIESFAASADEGVKQTFAQLDRCVAKNDAKCIGELMVDDVTYLDPMGGAIVKGKSQIVKNLEKVMGGSPPDATGAKQTHTVENVRAIGDDHAVVDCSVAVASPKPGEGGAPGAPSGSYHAVAVMVLRGDKWLFQDLRSYVVHAKAATTNDESKAPVKKDEAAAPADQGQPAAPADEPPPKD